MDYQRIYEGHADRYHRLVEREDCDHNLQPAIEAACPLRGARVVEVGAGTGRLTRLMASAGADVLATEPAEAMREVAQASLAGLGPGRARVVAGEGAALPAEAGCADLVIAGWVFGHQRSWYPDTWRETIGACIKEMQRVARPGGSLVIIETLGTGREEPAPPRPELGEYYRWLEEAWGFSRRAIRTDYRFLDPAEAVELCGFFFGEAMADAMEARGGAWLPECTGVWSVVRGG